MEKSKLNRWADLLLDTGKRNNLINFKDTKSGTLEVIMPMFDLLFSKVDSHARLEVFDPKIFDDEDDEKGTAEAKVKKKISKADFILKYRDKIKTLLATRQKLFLSDIHSAIFSHLKK